MTELAASEPGSEEEVLSLLRRKARRQRGAGVDPAPRSGRWPRDQLQGTTG
jgi:hypothetical protein